MDRVFMQVNVKVVFSFFGVYLIGYILLAVSH